MATVQVSSELIAQLLFKGLDVEIRDVRMNHSSQVLEFSICGDDVPDCEKAIITCHVHQEKGCDRWVRVEIEPARPLRPFPLKLEDVL